MFGSLISRLRNEFRTSSTTTLIGRVLTPFRSEQLQRHAIRRCPNQGSRLITGSCADHREESFLCKILCPLSVVRPRLSQAIAQLLHSSSNATRDPAWNSSIKASSPIIIGAPVSPARLFRGVCHISFMSQQGQKFPLRSISFIFLLISST